LKACREPAGDRVPAAMSVRPAAATLRLPRAGASVALGRDFDAAMEMLERADARNVKTETTPSLPAVILTASDGSSWRLVVDPGGALRTVAVPRS